MATRWRTITIGLLCILILAACGGSDDPDPTPTQSESRPARLRVTVSEGLVFQRPSRESDVLFRLIEGDELVPLAQTEPDSLDVAWYQVGQGDQFGWIAGSQVEVSGDLSELRTVAMEVEATPTDEVGGPVMIVPDGTAFAIILVDDTIIYDAPDPNAAERLRLEANDSAQIIGRLTANDQGIAYLFLALDGEPLGWVRASDVSIAGDLDAVVIVEDVGLALSETLPTVTVEAATAEAGQPTAATPRASLIPTLTPDLASTSQFAPTATDILLTPAGPPTQTPIPELQPGFAPPLAVTLPDGWQTAHILVPMNTVYFQGGLPISIYRGPLAGDVIGRMWIMWGFPNVTSPTGNVNLYGDGVQLLRGMIFDSESCEIGLGGEQRNYVVGGQAAIGTIYSAVNCEGSTDIAGFFAVTEVGGGNFAFYVGVEPVTATDIGLPQMQAILDTIVFEDAE